MEKYNLTPRVQKVISLAKETADNLKCDIVDLDHLLFAVLDSGQSTIVSFFEDLNISLDDFKTFVFNNIQGDFFSSSDSSKISFSKHFKEAFSESKVLCEKLNHNYIGVEHLFYSLICHEKSPLIDFFKTFKVSIKKSKEKLEKFFRTGEWDETKKRKKVSPPPIPQQDNSNQSSNLESYCKNYNLMALRGHFDKVIFKEEELSKISEILCRRNKNNPVLVGLPGTGKTTLVEGLAQSIVNGTCTSFLSNKIIYELDLAAMIAGTKYRGQFEERLKGLLKEVSNSNNIILFIDEIHTIIGAGSAEGSLDAANILKPSLARNKIKCIGATTPKEFKRFFTKDPALERRFEEVQVVQPSPKEAYEILKGISSQYEKFHHVIYRKNSLKLAVDLSVRYINDRQLPDKAIDIIDQAGAKVKMRNFKKPEKALLLEKKIDDSMHKDYDGFDKEQEDLLSQYKSVLESWTNSYQNKKFFVTKNDIYDVISSRTGIPVGNLTEKESNILLNLNNSLNKIVFGQSKACSAVSQCILRSKSGLTEGSKPVGSFLFLGQTGVGKTFMAKALAKHVFGSEDNLIHIDMSEYSEKINISRLIGSSPGYVGYEDGGQLTDKIKAKPYSVVLFDEIEKAHPDVLNVLLQLLDEGRLTDNFGRVSDFTNTIVILTSNIGARSLTKNTSVGFVSTKKESMSDARKEAEKKLTPELINRLDEIIVFNSFSLKDIKSFFINELKQLKSKVKKNNKIILEIDAEMVDFLSEEAYNKNLGARPVKRMIQKYIENDISKWIINQQTGKLTIKKPIQND